MDRRGFLIIPSLATLSAVGTWTGLSKAFAHSPSQSKNASPYAHDLSGNMEYRKLGGLDVSAIGLGCLPMVGYYGVSYAGRVARVTLRPDAAQFRQQNQ